MTGIRATGLDQVAATLRDAGADVADGTERNRQIAEAVAVKSRPQLPHRTGRLVASVRTRADARDAVITVAVPYARPVLFGAPRAGTRPARATPLSVAQDMTPQMVDLVTADCVAACNLVRG